MRNTLSRRTVLAVAIVALILLLISVQRRSDVVVVLFLMIAAFGCGFILAELLGAAQLADLRRHVGRFKETGNFRQKASQSGMSSELVQLYDAFDNLSRISIADEKRARQSHEDRSVLIREVHHRVKNNLQLMSSILSMHIQHAPDEATKEALRRVQQRVHGLGTVHKDIYQNSLSGELPVAGLLHEIADSAQKLAVTMGHAIDIDRRIMPAQLLPDQVVPLSLLVSEAMHAAVRATQTGVIILQFTINGNAVVSVKSVGELADHIDDVVTSKFMGVLATQLHGELQEVCQDGAYEVKLSFPASATSKPVA